MHEQKTIHCCIARMQVLLMIYLWEGLLSAVLRLLVGPWVVLRLLVVPLVVLLRVVDLWAVLLMVAEVL